MYKIPANAALPDAAIFPKAQPWHVEVKLPKDKWATLKDDYWTTTGPQWVEKLKASGTKKAKITREKAIKKAGGDIQFYRELALSILNSTAKGRPITLFTNLDFEERDNENKQ